MAVAGFRPNRRRFSGVGNASKSIRERELRGLFSGEYLKGRAVLPEIIYVKMGLDLIFAPVRTGTICF